MSNRHFSKAIQSLVREIWKLQRSMSKRLVNWLLRATFVANRRAQPTSGFILPTTVLLILVVSLTVGALTYRAYSRNTQVIVQNQQRVLYNAATPAIDRARSKLEFMFDSSKDTRYPGGVPQESYLMAMLLNDGKTKGLARLPLAAPDASGNTDPYTLPDETRLDLGARPGTGEMADNGPDNAWSFRTDTNGDGKEDATVVYSIVFSTPKGAGNLSFDQVLVRTNDADKAAAQIVRHGPLSNETQGACKVSSATGGNQAEEGWFLDASNTSTIRKNFQVDSFVIPDDSKSAAVTMEFHQDRQLNRGNKWGAWFRNDLEISPGPAFRWNGAMHTEGSFVFGGNAFNAFLISAKASCLFYPEASIISATNTTPKDATETDMDFQGQVMALGRVGTNTTPNQTSIPIHVQVGQGVNLNPTITPATDTVATTDKATMLTMLSEPERLLAADKYKSVKGDNNRAGSTWNAFKNGAMATRIVNTKEPAPYVDDLYRADDLWGPKPRYGPNKDDQIPADKKVGDEIVGKPNLTRNDPPTADAFGEVGFDGYWERRARNEGLRVLVGERLELGNLFGWNTARDNTKDGYIENPSSAQINFSASFLERDADPLYPPTVRPHPIDNDKVKTLTHIQQQRRSLRDNLAAVQSAAIYHGAVNKDYPVACLASTVHPGTSLTLRESTNFFPTLLKDGSSTTTLALFSNFLVGRGTNGLEFQPPDKDQATFESDVANTNSALRRALDNLANFAGDPDGAFPPKPNDTVVHPYPAMAMWGNFSNLRRALARLDAKGYANLSIADKTYIQTASCTVGMLAYNIDQIQRFDPTSRRYDLDSFNGESDLMVKLGEELYGYMDGDPSNGEVLTKAQQYWSGYDPASTNNSGVAGPEGEKNFFDVPPEAYIELLRQKYSADHPMVRLAEMIMLNFQVRRDRTFGFRSSPAFGTYVISVGSPTNPTTIAYPSACDPDLFPIFKQAVNAKPTAVGLSVDSNGNPQSLVPPSSPLPSVTLPDGIQLGALDMQRTQFARLGLSRLCGALELPRDEKSASGNGKTTYDPRDPKLDPKSATYDPAYAMITARPVVKPKFPALYYIFPEVDHDLDGDLVDTNSDFVADVAGEYDHRQPGHDDFMDGTEVTVSALNAIPPKTLKAAKAELVGLTVQQMTGLKSVPKGGKADKVSGDLEPYVVDDYVKKIANDKRVVFKRVQTDTTPKPATPYFNTAATINPVPISLLPPKTPLKPGFARYPDPTRTVFPIEDHGVSQVALQPVVDTNQWNLPFVDSPAADALNPNRIMLPRGITPESVRVLAWNTAGSYRSVAVPFLDKAFFDPRQSMLSRSMDIDIDILRKNKVKNQKASGGTPFAPDDVWLPVSGIVYAFREDAVREDAISRPENTQKNTMDVRDPGKPMDPKVPLTADNRGISTKPIDYLADPDRRPYGFRLRNGVDLKRADNLVGGNFKDGDNYRGLSFFTDQPLYVRGDYNLHQNAGGNLLEEFAEKIQDKAFNAADFYDSRKTLDTEFARPDKDRWRPSELLADSISIQSNAFCDGSAEDYFVQNPNNIDADRYHQPNYSGSNTGGLYELGCKNKDRTSFQNASRPDTNFKTNTWAWLRENPSVVTRSTAAANVANTVPLGKNPNTFNADITATYPNYLAIGGDPDTPIEISRIGEPLGIAPPKNGSGSLTEKPSRPVPAFFNDSSVSGNDPYSALANNARLSPAQATRLNSIVVSGIPPSRAGQSYGGLHNFPRFLENWGGVPLYFSGSFLQLSFSNYATAPFEAEAWELTNQGDLASADQSGEQIGYYSPPNRFWGYDVALQFAPAGPAASRFVSPSSTKNEFYSEPQVNDPYIRQLCQAAKAGKVPNVPAARRNSLACPT
ncbi:hormogonium polysaccharide biosynthesis protein HpsA [Alkalinema pantanalense CENA528]|uniref:hormogonium polysaccharide biosynthesis protein HpsA n=1 Tax=Alkalinema pantanalense TaxID=1620705 RepID=UPI003D6F2468